MFENSLSIWINILHILPEQNTHLFGVKHVAYFWGIMLNLRVVMLRNVALFSTDFVAFKFKVTG